MVSRSAIECGDNGVEKAWMIVRDEGATLLLITQPDHAHLAADLVAAMQTEPALRTAARPAVLLATREHDNGWAEVDAKPTVDPMGRPRDFMTGPAEVRRELWMRGITRVAKVHSRAGALVARHAVTMRPSGTTSCGSRRIPLAAPPCRCASSAGAFPRVRTATTPTCAPRSPRPPRSF